MRIVMLLCFVVFSGALVLSHGSRSCEEERVSAEEEYTRILYNTDELAYFYVPRCDAAGDWEPLQMDHNNMRWCVDAVTGDVISQKSELLTSCNGCLAGRLVRMKDVEIAQKSGATINNVYFPECQDVYPEYYEEKQCWVGYFNACWCVDTITGAATSMPSENDPTCETSPGGAISWCNIMEDLTRSYYRAYHTIKTRHYEQDPSVEAAQQTRVPDVLFHVQCDQQGNFVEDQCLDGVCWCVDPLTGLPTDNCDSRSKRNTWHLCHQNKVLQLEAYYEFVLRGVMLEHFTIPKCTRLGEWDVLQCANQTEQNTCWCVDAVTGKTTTNASRALRSCDSCRAHAMRSEYSGIEDYTSACDESGRYYTTVQCDEQLDQCWCVDHVAGEVLYFNPAREITGEECEEYDRVYHGRLG